MLLLYQQQLLGMVLVMKHRFMVGIDKYIEIKSYFEHKKDRKIVLVHNDKFSYRHYNQKYFNVDRKNCQCAYPSPA